MHSSAVGYADVEAKIPMTADTYMRIYSMTKIIVSVAVMLLVEDGKLDVNDEVEKYLPEFSSLRVNEPTEEEDVKKPVPLSKPLRVLHLLTHTAGTFFSSCHFEIEIQTFRTFVLTSLGHFSSSKSNYFFI